MDEQLKRRLVGATVLISLAIIFLPMLFGKKDELPSSAPQAVPAPPQRQFDSSLLTAEMVAPQPIQREAPAPLVEPLVDEPPVSVEPPPPGLVLVPTTVPETPSTPAVETEKPRVGLSAWVVQVGSFSSQENALKLVAKLREARFDTMDPERVDLKGKVHYRVRVGPEAARENAEKLLPKINQVSGLKGRVISYP